MDTRMKLQLIFQEVFDDSEIELFDEMTAEDVEDWDSLSHINLIIRIEKEFGIKFTVDEITDTENVGAFISIIENKTSVSDLGTDNHASNL